MARQWSILIVDDESFILSATAQFLRSSGYIVHTCDQWTGVASLVRDTSPDLVLMDYNMPGLKGDAMCRILKRNAIGAELPIVIFSSEPEEDLLRIVGECGADGYIPKTAPGHLLLKSLNAYCDDAVVA